MTDVRFPELDMKDPRAEVMVDKVTVEVPAPHAGVVHLLVAEEAAVGQGTPIARVE